MKLGAMNHLALTLSDLKGAEARFYKPVLEFLGYRKVEDEEAMTVWFSETTFGPSTSGRHRPTSPVRPTSATPRASTTSPSPRRTASRSTGCTPCSVRSARRWWTRRRSTTTRPGITPCSSPTPTA